jgi:two-component system sensor histidine kinase DctS
VRVTDVIDSCRTLIELQAKREAIQVEIPPNGTADTPVFGDPITLQQVVLNLTRNAIDAMSTSPPERRRLVISADADATGVTLSVRDYGPGVPERDAERIFAPFFTTKSEGMGMGLSICRTIVQAHGGRLWFERRDPGTEFVLWLPKAG